MKRWVLFIVAILFLSGCQTPTVTDVNIPTPPVKSESAIPTLNKTKDSVDKAKETTVLIVDRVKASKIEFEKQKTDIDTALELSKGIKSNAENKELVTVVDANYLWDVLNSVKTRNLFLEAKNKELEEYSNSLNTELQTTKKYTDDLNKLLSDIENEKEVLRMQNMDLVIQLKHQNASNSALQKENIKLTKQAADAKVYKKIIWGIGIGYLILVIIKNVIAIYAPGATFLKRF